jgi:error-prone DNA polymerase
MGARLILVEGHIQSSPEKVVHLVAERLIDRSSDLLLLSDDRLGRKPAVPNGPALIEPLHEPLHEPLQDDRRQHPDAPAQKLRHPRNVRILPRSRDFH